jgi:hypothetical protein
MIAQPEAPDRRKRPLRLAGEGKLNPTAILGPAEAAA